MARASKSLIQIRCHHFLLVLRGFLPLVGDRSFCRRHTHAQSREPSRLLVHAQPVFLLFSHDWFHRSYHKSSRISAVCVSRRPLPAYPPAHPPPTPLRPKPR